MVVINHSVLRSLLTYALDHLHWWAAEVVAEGRGQGGATAEEMYSRQWGKPERKADEAGG